MLYIKVVLILIALTVCSIIATPRLIRLPLKHQVEAKTARLFSEAIDAVLRDHFIVVTQNVDSVFSADSSVFSCELVQVGDSLGLSADLYIAEKNEAISERIWFEPQELSHDVIAEKIKAGIILKYFNRLDLARLQVTGSENAEILSDNELWGKMPFESFVRPGIYNLTVRGKWLFAENRTIQINAGDDTTLTVNLWELSRNVRYGLWTGGFLLAGTGIYLNHVQSGNYGTYQSLRSPEVSEYSAAYRKYRSSVVARNAVWTFSGLCFLASLIITIDIPF